MIAAESAGALNHVTVNGRLLQLPSNWDSPQLVWVATNLLAREWHLMLELGIANRHGVHADGDEALRSEGDRLCGCGEIRHDRSLEASCLLDDDEL